MGHPDTSVKGAGSVISRIGLSLVFTLVLTWSSLMAQPPGMGSSGEPGRRGGSITGSVVDSMAHAPLEYANIVLFDGQTGAQVDGTISHKDGRFELARLPAGVFDIEIKFMGYHARRIQDIRLAPPGMAVDLGTIGLRRAVIALDEIEVSAEKPDMVFKIDKKVINVDKQIAARSGTAVDVLENVPSITVDIEGNVSLRGSSSFTVLIDNRPTVLEPNEVLQQIPASTIDNIEIITNPSAKYDPDGVSGIINIITKKSKQGGVSGIVNLNGGLDYTYGGDFLVSYRRDNINAYLGMDYSRRESPGTVKTENRTRSDTVTSFVNSAGDSRWTRRRYNGKAGIEIGFTPRDLLSLEGRGGRTSWGRNADERFEEWMEPGDGHSRYGSHSESERTGDFYQGSMDLQHRFDDNGHELLGKAVVVRYEGDEESKTELLDAGSSITSGRRTYEDGPSTRLRFDLDYTLPLNEERRFEAGFQSRFDRMKTTSKFSEYDTSSAGYEFRPEYSHTTEYERDIHAVYALYAGALGPVGYQGGLRTEYVDRRVTLVGQEAFALDRWDFFPTLHMSYEYSAGHQMMASYTRRIDRPRSWYLEPFITWSDAYNVRQGNPSLKPEYVDSYELGYQKHFGPSMVSLEAYYRLTHNKVERVQSVYEENVILHTVENVGKDYTFGAEVMLNLGVARWWNVNLMGNLYDYRIEGRLYGSDFAEESFNWRVRANNTFRLTGSTRLQINGFYNSPTASAQGEREGFSSTDMALRQDFMNRTLSLAVQVRDVFRTGKFEFTSEGPDFYSHREFKRKAPSVSLTLTYSFNNYKQKQEEPEDRDMFGGEEEF
jgi:outer membrane receptor protein involved in Fe transport